MQADLASLPRGLRQLLAQTLRVAVAKTCSLTKPPLLSLSPTCRHEKVQENCIDLVGRIADRGAEFVPAREWMRICFELLDMLKVGAAALAGGCCWAGRWVF